MSKDLGGSENAETEAKGLVAFSVRCCYKVLARQLADWCRRRLRINVQERAGASERTGDGQRCEVCWERIVLFRKGLAQLFPDQSILGTIFCIWAFLKYFYSWRCPDCRRVPR